MMYFEWTKSQKKMWCHSPDYGTEREISNYQSLFKQDRVNNFLPESSPGKGKEHLLFIDFKSAYDPVDQKKLYKQPLNLVLLWRSIRMWRTRWGLPPDPVQKGWMESSNLHLLRFGSSQKHWEIQVVYTYIGISSENSSLDNDYWKPNRILKPIFGNRLL